MSRFINIFALSLFRDRIDLSPEYRQELIDLIFEMETASQGSPKPSHSVWLGDSMGYEFLFQNERFADLYRLIAEKVKQYTSELGINNPMVDFYFQRSWATVTREGERIDEHAHVQSNISFAYYLLKPENSGGIHFITHDHPNELSEGMFSPAKEAAGFIEKPGINTWNNIHIDAAEGEIIIFPSKTLHATAPNHSGQPRISISADITMMLRESRGHESMMPHFSNWQPFAG